MRVLSRTFSLVLVFLLAGTVWGGEPTGREIMEKYKAQDRTQDSSVQLKMTLINPRGGTRERQVTLVTKTDADDNRKQLIRFLSPADVKGTGFLSIEYSDRDDDNWLYLPALRKTRRIAGSDKTDSFMGSEFTYEDLDSEDLDAHKYTLIGSESIDSVETWIVEAVATDPKKIKETGYNKRELWISKDHALMIQAKFYDKQGAYVKLLKADDLRQVEPRLDRDKLREIPDQRSGDTDTDKWRAYRLTMENVQTGDKTVLELSDYQINQGVSDEFFSQRYLKRGR